jgi:FAD/FMN-containing dehydrogenase
MGAPTANPTLTERSVNELRRQLQGPVLLPGDDGYDDARRAWNAMVDKRPTVIAQCVDAADVVAAIAYGRREGLELGVKCGAHSVLGQAIPDGGLMIDLTPMNAVRIDPGARLAYVQGGALLGDLDRASAEHGLATTAGNVSHTGVGGLTLGGGMGWLARQFGMACDNVVTFEVVTADGAVLNASESQNPDLYWGLRGGGGNFGVVTQFTFRLHPITGAPSRWTSSTLRMPAWRSCAASAGTPSRRRPSRPPRPGSVTRRNGRTCRPSFTARAW